MTFDPEQLKTLQAIAFDVDGVLTDGGFLWGPSGEELKRFTFMDIMAVSLARRLGLKLALISGENSPLVTRYAQKMSIQHVAKGTRDKATALREFSAAVNIPLQHICFFGDDVNDLAAMHIAGLCACPSTAVPEVLAYVGSRGFVAQRPGGNGAVRDFIDAVIAARNTTGLEVFHLRPPAE